MDEKIMVFQRVWKRGGMLNTGNETSCISYVLDYSK